MWEVLQHVSSLWPVLLAKIQGIVGWSTLVEARWWRKVFLMYFCLLTRMPMALLSWTQKKSHGWELVSLLIAPHLFQAASWPCSPLFLVFSPGFVSVIIQAVWSFRSLTVSACSFCLLLHLNHIVHPHKTFFPFNILPENCPLRAFRYLSNLALWVEIRT